MAEALDGTLIRQEDGSWRWSDGTPEPRVCDMTASWYYNFRVQGGCVEVPVAVAQRESDLRWVWDGYTSGKYRESLSGDHTGPKVLHLGERYEDGDVPGISEPETVITHATPTRADGGKRAIPRVVLVPVAEWDECDKTPIGAKWDKADEPAILTKAASLKES